MARRGKADEAGAGEIIGLAEAETGGHIVRYFRRDRGGAKRRKPRLTAEQSANNVNHQPGLKCQGSTLGGTSPTTALKRELVWQIG